MAKVQDPNMKYLFLLLTFFATNVFAEKSPNIVFFFADDLGYGDLGCYGHPYAKTPNLDKLASEGTRFTQFYVTGVTCNPSRTGLMTGKHPASFQKYAAYFGFSGAETITNMLNKKGYATGHFGKWHIGPKSSEVDGTYGIDKVDIIGSSKGSDAGRDDDLTTAAIKFITANKDKPFYVNIWGHSTHYPVYAADSLAQNFKDVKVNRADFSGPMQKKFDECLQIGGKLDACMHQYLGDVYSIDLNMGRVLKAIDELGIRDNTIVVFSSDHGPAPIKLGGPKGVREYSKNMLGYASHFRGSKHNQLEGGVRVPFIIRWPNNVPAGRVESKSVGSFIDWLPTLAKIAGINELPDKLDGEDISDIWLGKSRARTTPLFWKVSSTGSGYSMRDGKWKMHTDKKLGNVELYDLDVDPAESNNLAQKNPKVTAALMQQMKAWAAELPKTYEKLEKKKKNKKK